MPATKLNPVTLVAGVTTNTWSPELVKFFHITVINGSSEAQDISAELDDDEAVKQLLQCVALRSDIMISRLANNASGDLDVCVQGDGYSATSLQVAIRALGTTVGVNNVDVSLSTVADTGMVLPT